MSLGRCCEAKRKAEDRIILCSSSSSSIINSSTDFWWNLPKDVKVEIFSRLPEKDLIASKFVCKDWNFVISRVCIPWLSSPHPSAPLLGLLTFESPLQDEDGGADSNDEKFYKPKFFPTCRYAGEYPEYFTRFLRGQPTMRDDILALLPSQDYYAAHVQDYCNGLLLLAFDSQYYVGNPTTKERLVVPRNPNNHLSKNSHSSLVFNPSLSLNFKIVSYTRPAEDASTTYPMGLDIFSSETGEWSCHILQLEPHNLYGFEWIRPSVYFNGALYYLSKAQYLVCIDNDILSGCSKDWSTFEAWAIELPDKYQTVTEQDPCYFGCIGNSSGCFYYSNRDVEGSFMFVWILVRKGKDSEWNLMHSVSMTHDIFSYLLFELVNPKKFLSLRPCAFHPNDEEIFMATPDIVISYHLKTKEVCDLYGPLAMEEGKVVLDENWIFPFFRCLLLLKTIPIPGKQRVIRCSSFKYP